jgi:hypothetical protein
VDLLAKENIFISTFTQVNESERSLTEPSADIGELSPNAALPEE